MTAETWISTKSLVRELYRSSGTISESSFGSLLRRGVPQQLKFFQATGPASRKLIGTPFPTEWRDMRRPTSNHYVSDEVQALRLAITKLCNSAPRLQVALESQRSTESHLITGHYQAARDSLALHRERFGISIWSIDLEFLIRQFSQGFHGNRTALSAFYRECDSDWVRLLANNSSFRCESNVSTREYLESLSFLDEVTEADSIPQYSRDYLRFRFLDRLPTAPTALCNVLHFEARHAVSDQFQTTLQLLQGRIWAPHQEMELASLQVLAQQINDSGISSLLFVATKGAFATALKWQAEHDLCNGFYLQGLYAASCSIAQQLLAESPTDFLLYHITAVSAARDNATESPQVFPSLSPGQQLLECLFDWYSARRERRTALEELRRLARALHTTRIGPGLHGFIRLIDGQGISLGIDCPTPLGTEFATPQLALGYANPHDGLDFIKSYKSHFGDSNAVAVVEAFLVACIDQAHPFAVSAVSSAATHRYRGLAEMHHNLYPEAAATFRDFRSQHMQNSTLYPEIISAESTALLQMGEIESAAHLVAALYCDDSRLVPPSVLKQFASLLGDHSFVSSRHNIAWPLLAAAGLRSEEHLLDVDRVHDFVGDYIEASGNLKPTELLAHTDEPTRELIVFLLDCCTPQVLECSMWYASREAVLKERLSLCNILHDKCHIDNDEIVAEIAELTRKLAILDLTSRIERSRIFVDTEAIISKLTESTHDHISSLLTIRALKDNDLKRGLKLMGMPSSEGGHVVVVSMDQDLAFFDKVLDKIMHGFLYSPEHGLDGNLSQRIRHGTLAGELRAIFDNARLSTKSSNDSYLSNEYWLSVFGIAEIVDSQAINHEFRTFSKQLDDLFKEVREDWIQIQSETKRHGLFNYDFSVEERRALLEKLSPLADHRDVYDLIIEALWERTETCLSKVRDAFNDTLAARIELLCNNLQSGIEGIASRTGLPNIAALRGAITQCRTETDRVLEKVAEWFRMEDLHEQKSFVFRDLLESVHQVLNRIGSKCDVQLIDRDDSVLLLGRFFRPLWDTFVILLDNATKHSALSKTPVYIEVAFSEDESWLSCENEVSATQSQAELGEIAMALNKLSLSNQNDLNKLRQEGGSGVAKLHKIVRHELGAGADQYRIEFSVAENGRFRVVISCNRGLANAASSDR